MNRTPEGGDAGLQLGPGSQLLGRVLDLRYRIKSVLGVGGMGTVYRAEQFSMHRDVAVKVVRRDIQDEHLINRFLTEAAAASRLKSPHTVTVFDFGRTPDGILYIAMELLDGRTLAREIRAEGRPFPAARALHLVEQVLSSMEEAHGAGILHRDLKPDNIFLLDLLGSRDFLKVLDFGVAKLVGDTAHRTTVAGVSFGTPLYMSPEQMVGGEVGPPTDLYSVALLLMELLAGKVPLEDLNPVEIALRKVRGTLPSLRQVNPRLEPPDALEAFLARALSPAPAKRPPDVDTFRQELRAAVEGMVETTAHRLPAHRTPAPDVVFPPVRDTVVQGPFDPSEPPAAAASPVHASTIRGVPWPGEARATRAPIVTQIVVTPPPEALACDTQRVPPRPPVADRPRMGAALERRKRVRTPSLRAVVCLAGAASHKALVSDVSEAGAYLFSQWLPEPGQSLSILFRAAGDRVGPPITIAARVVRIVEQPASRGGVRGFSVRWVVLRAQGRLAVLKDFYRELFGAELPGTHHHAEANLWEYSFETRRLQRDVART